MTTKIKMIERIRLRERVGIDQRVAEMAIPNLAGWQISSGLWSYRRIEGTWQMRIYPPFDMIGIEIRWLDKTGGKDFQQQFVTHYPLGRKEIEDHGWAACQDYIRLFIEEQV